MPETSPEAVREFGQALTDKLSRQLADGILSLDLILSEEAQNKLLTYLAHLHRWNKAYNLSGIKDPEQMMTLHILDSLSVVPFIQGKLILDVGTGAGLPGIPLAIYYPDKQFKLVDSNSKKTRFIFQTAAALKLGNVEAVHSRIRDYPHNDSKGYAIAEQVDIVISRAFASLRDFVEGCQHLSGKNGVLLAMKGQYPEEEIAQLPPGFAVVKSHFVDIPGGDVQRHVLEIKQQQASVG